jgi:hypothetical protein
VRLCAACFYLSPVVAAAVAVGVVALLADAGAGRSAKALVLVIGGVVGVGLSAASAFLHPVPILRRPSAGGAFLLSPVIYLLAAIVFAVVADGYVRL